MKQLILHILLCLSVLLFGSIHAQQKNSSVLVTQHDNGTLSYHPLSDRTTLPDFSGVGYGGGTALLPDIAVVKTITAPAGFADSIIQLAIDEVSRLPLQNNGFRGAILLRKGQYLVRGTINIRSSGIVLRGEGQETVVIASGKGQRNLISVAGSGRIQPSGSMTRINESFVPVGTKSFRTVSAHNFAAGDSIILYRPATANWIADLRMNQIEVKDDSTRQWEPKDFNLSFERIITKIIGDTVYVDQPVVMQMEEKYGGGFIYKYSFPGRVDHVGIQNLRCQSDFVSDTDENHGWNAVHFNNAQQCFVSNITAVHFGYSCVNIGSFARNITVDSCRYLQPKSQITGGRRYSFNIDGQLNLVKNCFASEGRHDYVTGARVCGPNVFYNCRSENARADIGPHHRWAVGTLYDNIITDGEINAQDRGNWGTGHGWSGVTQVFWNCTASRAAIQDPYVSGRNFVIGLKAIPYAGRLLGRPLTIWEAIDATTVLPASLYLAQLNARLLEINQ